MAGHDERTSYEDMEAIIFGMDPGDWAATLHQKLSAGSMLLAAARARDADHSREITRSTEANDLAAIRSAVTAYVAGLLQMLSSMPMMQMRPEPLEALHYILTSLADVERGAAPAWLVAKATRRHPEKLEKEVEWQAIITCLVLLQLNPNFASVNRAAKEMARRTRRPVGTIKDWYDKLYHPQKFSRRVARQEIEDVLTELRVVSSLADPAQLPALIERRIGLLLG